MRATRQTISLLFLSACGAAHAVPIVIWDQTTGATGGVASGLYSNQADGQNFADPVAFDASMLLTGFDVYTGTIVDRQGGIYEYGAPGTQVVIRIRQGSPTGSLLEIRSTISVRDQDGAPVGQIPNAPPNEGQFFRAYADLEIPIQLDAGAVYWVGMSGDREELGQGFMNGGSGLLLDQVVSQYSDRRFMFENSLLGDSQFRLWGGVASKSVPEPGTFALLLSALVGLIWTRKRAPIRL